MKPTVFASHREYQSLNLYQRMIECFSAAWQVNARYLDSMNYSPDEFRDVLDFRKAGDLLCPEHGYTIADGTWEFDPLIRELETLRLMANAGQSRGEAAKIIRASAIGVGPGTTGVANGILSSIVDLSALRLKPQDAEVILPLPTYPVYDSILQQKGIKPRYVYTRPENKFLPTAREIKEYVNRRTIALVLVYPNNPSFTTYEDPKELKSIVELCQKKGIFIIADNIYQDLIFNGQKHIEILSLADSPDFLIKIFGLSKDRPFFTGHRAGYFIGDPRVKEHFHNYCVSSHICLTSITKSLFEFDLLFRILMHKGLAQVSLNEARLLRPLSLDSDLRERMDYQRLLGEINRASLFEIYKTNAEFNREKIKNNLRELVEYVRQSECFSGVSNDQIGNAVFVKVNPRYYSGTDMDFFEGLLRERGMAVLPGNNFGMRIKRKEAWFRFVVVHKSKEEIFGMLQEVESFLQKNRRLENPRVVLLVKPPFSANPSRTSVIKNWWAGLSRPLPVSGGLAIAEKEKLLVKQAMAEVIDQRSHYGFAGQPNVKRFEQALSLRLGQLPVLGVSSGTDALILALKVLGIGPGDEVIAPAFSYISTASSISWIGATPVFVDIGLSDYAVDFAKIESKVNSRTRAIVVVHLFGRPASNIAKILDLAKRHKLFVIEDAGQSFGAELKVNDEWRAVGTLGDVGCFSFSPTKPLAAPGGGGALVIKNKLLFEEADRMQSYGARTHYYDYPTVGINCKMHDIQAAALLVRLRFFDHWFLHRYRLAEHYTCELAGLDNLILPQEPGGIKNAWYRYAILTKRRERLFNHLFKIAEPSDLLQPHKDIPVPLPSLVAFGHLGYRPGDFPVAERVLREMIYLPINNYVALDYARRITEAIKYFLSRSLGGHG